MDLSSRERDLDRMYVTLEEVVEPPARLAEMSRRPCPERAGVYCFFEQGEVRRDGRPRVVRVGESGNLRSRLLRQHLTGTHRDDCFDRHGLRSSVFRHHVGLALIRRHGLSLLGHTTEETAGKWASLKTSEPSNESERNFERDVEDQVTQTISAMSVAWRVVNSDRSDRQWLEENLIRLFSNYRGGADPASTGWLGSFHRDERIRQSGLWNVKHVEGDYDSGVVDRFRR